MTFDPTNPYRRKSSLVSSDINNVPLSSIRSSECIVHQLIEAQRRGGGSRSSNNLDAAERRFQTHPIYETEADSSDALTMPVSGAPRKRRESRAQIDLASLPDGKAMGQSDQQRWAHEMTRTESDVNLSRHGSQFLPQGPHEELHSRMLTKRQLSDMAWGVRELSRRLSSMRIKFRVKSILILTKIYDLELIPKTRELAKWLLEEGRHVRYTVYVQDKLKDSKKFDASGLVDELVEMSASPDKQKVRDDAQQRLRYWSEDMCRSRPHTFDFVITLGGDGTVLYASWLFQRIVPPILSFALGSLGFLTKFDFEDYEETLQSAFDKGVTVSLRLRFESTVMRSIRRKVVADSDNDKESSEEDEEEIHRKRDLVEELIGEEKEDFHTHRPDGTFEILNEVVVDRGPNPSTFFFLADTYMRWHRLANRYNIAMSYTEVFGDDEHFTSVLADGICVSTPTGSTAYNLAAGGSLCHPENPVMLVTSICAHTLSFRPIILPDTIVLRVGVPYDARTSSWASFDGRERVELQPGDYVTISASRYPFASVQAEGRRSEDWVNSISGKLGWNTRQKQKELSRQWND